MDSENHIRHCMQYEFEKGSSMMLALKNIQQTFGIKSLNEENFKQLYKKLQHSEKSHIHADDEDSASNGGENSTKNANDTESMIAALERQHNFEKSLRIYRERKHNDEKELRNKEIMLLEKEKNERLKARINRQIKNEEFMRLNLKLEGLMLELRPKEEPFPELPEEAQDLLDRAWDMRGPLNEVFSSAFSIDITRRDLLSLRGLEWLNDEVVNFYLNLIMERSRQNTDMPRVYAFNTFFYESLSTKGYDAVKRWTRKVDIFSYDMLLIPIHLSVHWCMATVDLTNKRITYYDSMLGDNNICLEILRNYLTQEHENKKKLPLNTAGWKAFAPKDIPRQQNGSDCGMFACKFAEYASRRAEINFNQSHMPYFRRRMVYEICTQKLL